MAEFNIELTTSSSLNAISVTNTEQPLYFHVVDVSSPRASVGAISETSFVFSGLHLSISKCTVCFVGLHCNCDKLTGHWWSTAISELWTELCGFTLSCLKYVCF